MEQSFKRLSGTAVESVRSIDPIVSILDQAVVTVTPAPSESGDFVRPLGNPEQNSRLGRALPDGAWKLRWRAPLRGLGTPLDVLSAGDRVVVRAESGWMLFDADGEMLARGPAGDGTMLLDPNDGLLLGLDGAGFLAGWGLADGARRFRMILTMPGDLTYTFIDRPGDLYLASVERRLPPHTPGVPSAAFVERITLGAPIAVDDNGTLRSAARLGDLVREVSDLQIARRGETFVLAVTDTLYRADLALRLSARLTGSFRPLALSLDEQGRAHLVVMTATGPALWVVEPDGRRVVDRSVPLTSKRLLAPPIISHHHQIYLVYADRITAFESDGRSWWDTRLDTIAGAVLTADDQLLVAAGRQVLAYRGAAAAVLATALDPLVTPPILSGTGLLLVASADALFAYEATGKRP